MATKPQAELSDDQLQLITRALADPRRYEILKKIVAGTESCAAMRCCVCISPATLSRHTKELETAGLIKAEKDGKFVNFIPQTHILKAYFSRLKSDLI